MRLLELKTVKRKDGLEFIEVTAGKTSILIEVSLNNRDVRLCNGKTVLKIELTPDLKVGRILKDDIIIGEG